MVTRNIYKAIRQLKNADPPQKEFRVIISALETSLTDKQVLYSVRKVVADCEENLVEVMVVKKDGGIERVKRSGSLVASLSGRRSTSAGRSIAHAASSAEEHRSPKPESGVRLLGGVPESDGAGVALKQVGSTVRVPKAYQGNYDDFLPLEISGDTKSQLAELRRLARENGFEYAQIVRDGVPGAILTSNSPSGVQVSISEADGFGLTLLHSHTNETPLSRGDFRYFCNDQVDCVGNVAINGDAFVASVGNGWRPTANEFDRIASAIADDVDFDVMQMPEYGTWSPEERNYAAIREQAYRIARHFEWEMMGGSINE